MKRRLTAFAVLALAAGGLFAEGLQFDFKGIVLNWAVPGVSGLPVPTGADLQFGLPVAAIGGHPLTLVARLRGGWEDGRILRDAATGDPRTEPSDFEGAYRYYMPNFQWALGATQGILQKEKGNLVEAFAFYRGRYDVYNSSLSSGVFADMQGISGTSFLLGLAYDSTSGDSRRVKDGLFAEASVEYGPAALNVARLSDAELGFWRVDLKARGYQPLLSMGKASDERLNLFSAYLAGFASVDCSGGDEPIWVMQSFGGRDLRGSLGDCVRGYPTDSYDTSFKAVANGELRAIGPAIAGQAWFVPMAYAFIDLGYYNGFAGATASAEAGGTIASAGAGLNLNVLDFVNLGAYAGWKFPAGSSLYEVYTEDESFFWSIQFLLHF